MTKSFIRHALVLASFALVSQAHALVEAGHWRVYAFDEGDNVVFYPEPDTRPDGGHHASFEISYAGGVLTGMDYAFFPGEGADLFLVQQGAIFSNETVVSQSLPIIYGVSVGDRAHPPSVVVGQDFYLGARISTASEASNFDTFGWAHVKVDALGQFQLLDSAMAFKEGGIVVGTLQAVPVPEPSTIALIGIGLAVLACTARPRRRRSIA